MKLDDVTLARQALRLGRMRKALASHLVVALLIVLCGVLDVLPGWAIVAYLGVTFLVQAAFHGVFLLHLNLRFRDPSLTFWQVLAPIPPGLWLAYFMSDATLRPVIPMLVAIPALYAVLALGTRQLLGVAGFFLGSYLVLLLAVWRRDPAVFDPVQEGIVLLAFVVLMVQLAVVGGFISQLRRTLHARNVQLRGTMARLNTAMAELEVLATQDPLTGVYNRRRVLERLEEELEHSRRGEVPLSVCMLDVDHFKEINDAHGHQAGDAVLRDIATSLAATLRSTDSLGRYGGEEFLLVLPHTPLEGALEKADRVRHAVRACRAGQDTAVTVSIGVATWRPGDTLDALVARADAALYEAKTGGRDRVVLERGVVLSG